MIVSTNAQTDKVKTSTITVNGCTVTKRECGHILTYSMMNQQPTTTGDFVMDDVSDVTPFICTIHSGAVANYGGVGIVFPHLNKLYMRIDTVVNWSGFILTLIREKTV